MTTKIRLGEIFAAKEFDSAVARLLIIARQADTIVQSLRRISDTDERKLEDQVFLMGLYLASLKELVDAVHFLESRKYLDKICSSENPFTDLRQDAIEAISFLNKDDPSSLYSQLLTKVRNNAGFHVNLKEIQASLAKHKDTLVTPAVTKGEERAVETIPFIPLIMADIGFPDSVDIKKSLDDAARLHYAASRVAMDIFFIQVRIAENS